MKNAVRIGSVVCLRLPVKEALTHVTDLQVRDRASASPHLHQLQNTEGLWGPWFTDRMVPGGSEHQLCAQPSGQSNGRFVRKQNKTK